jgi:hypothetical protein
MKNRILLSLAAAALALSLASAHDAWAASNSVNAAAYGSSYGGMGPMGANGGSNLASTSSTTAKSLGLTGEPIIAGQGGSSGGLNCTPDDSGCVGKAGALSNSAFGVAGGAPVRNDLIIVR